MNRLRGRENNAEKNRRAKKTNRGAPFSSPVCHRLALFSQCFRHCGTCSRAKLYNFLKSSSGEGCKRNFEPTHSISKLPYSHSFSRELNFSKSTNQSSARRYFRDFTGNKGKKPFKFFETSSSSRCFSLAKICEDKVLSYSPAYERRWRKLK